MNNHSSPNPFLPLLNGHWQSLAQQNLNTLGETNAETVKATLDQFWAGQQQMAQLTGLVTQAWSAMSANNATANSWQAAVDSYIAQLRQQMTALADSSGMAQSQELWQLYGQAIQKASQPWANFWMQTPQWLTQAMSNPFSAAPLQATNQALGEAISQSWNGLLGAPALGLNRQFQEKLNRWATLALENQQALRDYQLLVGNAWLEAFAALLQKLGGLTQNGKMLESPRQLLDLWVEVADAKFLDLFHSDRYAAAQGKLVNSGMALRQQQRELTEIWLRQNDLPTRSDLDEAHHSIYELRKEVKALKKKLGALPAPATPEPVTQPKGRQGRRTSSK